MLPRTVTLWLLRFVLIGALILHVHAAYTLTVLNRRARPVKYQSPRDYIVANFASRTMRWTGIIVLLFLVWHLADLTVGLGQPRLRAGRGVPQRRRQPRPGGPSRCSTSSPTSRSASTCSTARGACSSRWGGRTPGSTSGGDTSPPAIATIVVVGNVSFPIAVLAGIVEI